MSTTEQASPAALRRRLDALEAEYQSVRARALALDMTRGKPCPEQLDLSLPMLDCVTATDWRGDGGADYRNYGGLAGIAEARALFAQYLDARPEEVLVWGNASLNLMHDTIRHAWLHGLPGGHPPWRTLDRVRFLCPSPGYDRHFTICEYFGIEMVPVAMGADGPDMDEVEALAASDPTVKGMWLVPKYSNPTGVTCSDEVMMRLAAMSTAAPDFVLLCDNAYAVHDLYDDGDRLMPPLAACQQAGHPQRVFVYGSTSKITFAGAGVCAVAASSDNLAWLQAGLATQSIGPDKLNQLRHVRFLRDMDGVRALMRRHAAIIRPKFEAVYEVLEARLGGRGVASWTRPRGGYFISLDVPDGCARAVVRRAADAGVRLTPAGATFPYGRDPRDRNIRLAPTFPSVEEVRSAMEVVALAVELVALERALGASAGGA